MKRIITPQEAERLQCENGPALYYALRNLMYLEALCDARKDGDAFAVARRALAKADGEI